MTVKLKLYYSVTELFNSYPCASKEERILKNLTRNGKGRNGATAGEPNICEEKHF